MSSYKHGFKDGEIEGFKRGRLEAEKRELKFLKDNYVTKHDEDCINRIKQLSKEIRGKK